VLGPVKYGTDEGEVFLGRDFSSTPNYSEEVAAKIDEEVRAIITNAYNKAVEVLTENRAKLDFVADFLVKNEVMDGDQFKAAMESDATIEDIEKIVEEKKSKRKAENEEKAKQKEVKDDNLPV
ncbi:MAG: hypothetical protein J5894_03695, partial [Clostridia bacterium]|nr:hypothetical protein [Clostridia bacterium]